MEIDDTPVARQPKKIEQSLSVAAPIKRVATARETAALIGQGLRKFKDRVRDDPTFPKPIRLSEKQPVWRIADIDRWLASLPVVEATPEPESLRRARLARVAAGVR